MLADLIFTLRNWRLIHLLGISSLRARYARSRFGQTWLSITTFIQILCTGLVWSLIWKMEIDEYLPYVGVGHILYLFFSQSVNDSTGVFVADSRLYLNDKLPFMTSISAHLYRNIVIFLHNIPTIILLITWSSHARFSFSISLLYGVFFSSFFIFFASYFFAVICTRFRDLIQLVGLLFQLIFLVTPIMWKITFLPDYAQGYVFINPFASILELIRNPIIGIEVNQLALISIISWTILFSILSYFSYKFMNKKIIFWI